MTNVEIDTAYITLAAFLKFSGAAMSGGEAKQAILSGEVLVDGEVCFQKGRKLRGGEIVSYAGSDYAVATPT